MSRHSATDYWNALDEYKKNELVGKALGKVGLELMSEFLPNYSGNDSAALSILDALPTLDFGKKRYNNEHYKYLRTTITHTKKKVKVCVQTDGYSFPAESEKFADAMCISFLRSMNVCEV